MTLGADSVYIKNKSCILIAKSLKGKKEKILLLYVYSPSLHFHLWDLKKDVANFNHPKSLALELHRDDPSSLHFMGKGRYQEIKCLLGSFSLDSYDSIFWFPFNFSVFPYPFPGSSPDVLSVVPSSSLPLILLPPLHTLLSSAITFVLISQLSNGAKFPN